MNTKYLLITLLFLVTLIASCSRGVAKINTGPDGSALRGFDPVAYFSTGSPTVGDPAIAFTWNGAKWLFSTSDNLEKFKLNPEAYAPQFGGYCSYAVAHGYTADGDPNVWKIVDGKLYLNYNEKAKAAWEKEQTRFIDDASRNWIEFQTRKPEHKK